jgi:hypothetical protein
MAAPQQASLAPSFVLASGMKVVVTAIDAVTGALVSPVGISDVRISVDTSSTDTGNVGEAPQPLLVPADV